MITVLFLFLCCLLKQKQYVYVVLCVRKITVLFKLFCVLEHDSAVLLVSCTLHFGFNYEINYQLDAIEYLFALSSFSSTCFGLTRPSSGAIGVTISYKFSIWCPWFLPGKVSVLRSVCAVGVLHCNMKMGV